ncbi:hypothetical protein ACFL16_00115 [Patescibacteria group bacterium]
MLLKDVLFIVALLLKSMYLRDENIDRTTWMQGDILVDFNCPMLIAEGESFKVIKKKKDIILLSQSCDLQLERDNNERFIFCPLIKETTLRNNLELEGVPKEHIKGRMSSFKGNKKIGLLYFPAKNDAEEDLFAVLTQITSLEGSVLSNVEVNTRLSDGGRHYLSDNLHTFFCRAIDLTR